MTANDRPANTAQSGGLKQMTGVGPQFTVASSIGIRVDSNDFQA
jgi:hypothetical protein